MLSWLQEDPYAEAIALLNRLKYAHPDRCSYTHLRTLPRRVSSGPASWPKSWPTLRLVSPWRNSLQCRNQRWLGGPPGAKVSVTFLNEARGLVRKPGAFARYRFREQLFPTMHFRLTYDALRQWRGERADVEYVRILHLAATTMAATVDSALSLLLEAGESFDYAEVRDLAEPKVPEAPVLVWSGKPDLKIYDRLLTVSLAAAGVCA